MICSKKSDFNYTEYAAPLHNTILYLSYFISTEAWTWLLQSPEVSRLNFFRLTTVTRPTDTEDFNWDFQNSGQK